MRLGLEIVGTLCFALSALAQLRAWMHKAPEASSWSMFWRGSFQRRADYTERGWQLWRRAWLWAGLALLCWAVAILAWPEHG